MIAGVRGLKDRRVFLTRIGTIRISRSCVSRGNGFRLGGANLLTCSRKRCLKLKGGVKAFKCDIEGGGAIGGQATGGVAAGGRSENGGSPRGEATGGGAAFVGGKGIGG